VAEGSADGVDVGEAVGSGVYVAVGTGLVAGSAVGVASASLVASAARPVPADIGATLPRFDLVLWGPALLPALRAAAKSLDMPFFVVASARLWREAISFCRIGDCFSRFAPSQ
jgi:hypothetical protein